MAGTYVKDAYKTVYSHNQWEKEAKAYETALGVMLYKSPYVINAAQTVLQRLSRVLNAYYGETPGERPAVEDEKKEAERSAIGEIAGQITGQKPPETAPETEPEGTAPERKIPEITVPVQYVDVDRESGFDVPKGSFPEEVPDVTFPEEFLPQGTFSGDLPTESVMPDIPVTDTLMASYLKNAPDSAGQIGSAYEEGDELSRMADVGDTYDVLNVNGNLREKMTMIFNSTLLNGGRTDEETSGSVSFKRLLRDITRQQAESDSDLSGLNMDDIEKVRKKGKDVFGIGRLVSKLGHTSLSEKISAFFGSRSRQRRESKPESEEPGLGYEYYKRLGIKPSKREKSHAVTRREGRKFLKWKEGSAYWGIDRSSRWAKKMAEKGRILTAGPSGTAQRMLSAYRFLGASDKELFDFRLALMGWMLTSQDHSLYEIMMGSQTVGVKGQEDLSEAAEMYRTVYPLSTEQLRNNVAVEKEFPHERVFKAMLREIALKRQAAAESSNDERGLLTDIGNPDSHTAEELAINMYTTAAYRTMTPSQKYGSGIGKWQMNKLRSRGEGAYKGSKLDEKDKFENELYDEIFDVIQVASRISYEGLAEAGAKAPGEEETGNAGTNKLASKAYKGTVYRGEGLSIFSKKYNKVGGTVTLKAMTSTSKNMDNAEMFRNNVHSKMKKPVLVTIRLTGKSGVDISQISTYKAEQEVLVPAGTQFTVTEALERDPDGNYTAELEESSGSDSYLKRVSGIQAGEGMPAPFELSETSQETEETSTESEVSDFTAPQLPMPKYLSDMFTERKEEIGDSGYVEYMDAINMYMQTLYPGDEVYDALQAQGVNPSDSSNTTKIVNWYLACALDFEYEATKSLFGADMFAELMDQIPSLAENQASQLMFIPK